MASTTSLVALVLGFDQIASVALVVALLVRHLFPTRLATIGVALVAVAIAVSSHEPLEAGAACAIAFGLLAREYALLVCAHLFGVAGWGSRPRGTSTVVIEGALVGYLIADRPESVLLVLAACCLLWALVVTLVSGVAIARREARIPARERKARLVGRARWQRLGEGSRAVRDPAFWGLVVARPIARLALYPVAELVWVTPNRITALSVVCCAAGAVMIAMQIALPLAITLIFARSVLDSMDGQLARYRGCGSQLGSYVDKVSDQFCWAALYAALAVRAHAADPTAWLLVPLLAGSWFALSSTALWLARSVTVATRSAAASSAPWASNLWRIVLFEEPDFYLWIALAVVTARYDLFVPLIAAGHAARGLVLVITRIDCYRTGRRRRRFDLTA